MLHWSIIHIRLFFNFRLSFYFYTINLLLLDVNVRSTGQRNPNFFIINKSIDYNSLKWTWDEGRNKAYNKKVSGKDIWNVFVNLLRLKLIQKQKRQNEILKA
jgi:hypothetical protein